MCHNHTFVLDSEYNSSSIRMTWFYIHIQSTGTWKLIRDSRIVVDVSTATQQKSVYQCDIIIYHCITFQYSQIELALEMKNRFFNCTQQKSDKHLIWSHCWFLVQQWKLTSLRDESSRAPWYSSILVWMPQMPPLLQSLLQPPYSPQVMPRPSRVGLLLQRKRMLLADVSSPKMPWWGSTRSWNELNVPEGHHWGSVHSPKLRRKKKFNSAEKSKCSRFGDCLLQS